MYRFSEFPCLLLTVLLSLVLFSSLDEWKQQKAVLDSAQVGKLFRLGFVKLEENSAIGSSTTDVHIHVAESDLNHPRHGILANPLSKRSQFERMAEVVLPGYKGDAIIGIHGRGTRLSRRLSYRLKIADGRELILKSSGTYREWVSQHLFLSLARELGLSDPGFKRVKVVINQRNQGTYLLAEAAKPGSRLEPLKMSQGQWVQNKQSLNYLGLQLFSAHSDWPHNNVSFLGGASQGYFEVWDGEQTFRLRHVKLPSISCIMGMVSPSNLCGDYNRSFPLESLSMGLMATQEGVHYFCDHMQALLNSTLSEQSLKQHFQRVKEQVLPDYLDWDISEEEAQLVLLGIESFLQQRADIFLKELNGMDQSLKDKSAGWQKIVAVWFENFWHDPERDNKILHAKILSAEGAEDRDLRLANLHEQHPHHGLLRQERLKQLLKTANRQSIAETLFQLSGKHYSSNPALCLSLLDLALAIWPWHQESLKDRISLSTKEERSCLEDINESPVLNECHPAAQILFARQNIRAANDLFLEIDTSVSLTYEEKLLHLHKVLSLDPYHGKAVLEIERVHAKMNALMMN